LAINTFQNFPGSGCTSHDQAAQAINEACGGTPASAVPPANGIAAKAPTMAPHCPEGQIYRQELGCISTVKPKCSADEVQIDTWCFPKDPTRFSLKAYQVGLGGVGALAVLFLIIGGYTILTSKGDPRRLDSGKKFIVYAVTGLLLAIFGLLFFETLTVDILRIPGFKH